MIANRIRPQALVAGAALALLSGTPLAQGSDVVRIVVPIGAGNPFDSSARALAEALSRVIGKSVIVDNKAGAGGRIGTAEVAKAKPDGNTLLFTTAGHATNAGLYEKLGYDPVKDFTPITITTASSGFVMMVRADSSYKSVADVVKAARETPGKVSYGSFGNGNTTHVIGAMFARSARVDLIHAPYRSPVNDFLGGHVDMVFMGTSTAIPLIKGGRARPIAISSEKRDPDLPDVPTFAELGYQDVSVPAWSAFLAPGGMSPQATQKLFEQISQAVKSASYQETLKITGAKVILMPPAEFSKYLAADVARFRKVLPELGIKGD